MTDDHDEFAGQALADPVVRDAYRQAAVRRGLIEAYWKLRDHASALRDTDVYSRWVNRSEDQSLTDEQRRRARDKVWNLETRCRGIEEGARDLAEMLGIPEHEIERP